MGTCLSGIRGCAGLIWFVLAGRWLCRSWPSRMGAWCCGPALVGQSHCRPGWQRDGKRCGQHASLAWRDRRSAPGWAALFIEENGLW